MLAGIGAADVGARVILMTGLPEDHPAVVHALSQGGTAFLRKPLRREEVREVLRTLETEAGRLPER